MCELSQDIHGDAELATGKTPTMELLGDFSKGGREALSPGAGLSSADEQAEAALADLMFTSMAGNEDLVCLQYRSLFVYRPCLKPFSCMFIAVRQHRTVRMLLVLPTFCIFFNMGLLKRICSSFSGWNMHS